MASEMCRSAFEIEMNFQVVFFQVWKSGGMMTGNDQFRFKWPGTRFLSLDIPLLLIAQNALKRAINERKEVLPERSQARYEISVKMLCQTQRFLRAKFW